VRKPDIFLKHLAYELGPERPGDPRNPFRDLRVRQALNIAIDRDQLVRRLPAPAVAASQLAPPFIFGFDPSIAPSASDPGRARLLLAEAGYPRGFSVRFDVRRIFEPAARLVREQLAAVGIDADLRLYSDAEFSKLDVPGAKTFVLERFGCPTGDVSDFLDNVVHSADSGRHLGNFNLAGFSRPDLDRLIEKSETVTDSQMRRTALQRIVRDVMSDLVVVPLYVDEDVYVMDESIEWRPRNDGIVFLSEIRSRR
jgi:peptide/nickel transport system substrate-binding protein